MAESLPKKNLDRARRKNSGRDRKALDSYSATRSRVERILNNHNLFLPWSRRREIIANIRAGRTSFDWLRDRSDVWMKNHRARVLDKNRDTRFNGDLTAIRGGYNDIQNRLKMIYQNRNLPIDNDIIAAEARRILQEKVTFEGIRSKTDRLRRAYDTSGGTEDIADDLDDDAVSEEPFDFNAVVKGLFPFLPDALIEAYVSGWEETGEPANGLQAMRDHAAYERHFPGNKLAPGEFAMSEADYISYRSQARDLMREYNLPTEYFDKDDDIGKLVSGQVRLSQLEERIRQGYVAAMQASDEVREELASQFGFGIGDLAAFWLDPTRGEDLLKRKYTEAQIRAEARTTGYGSIEAEDSELLAQYGVDADAARQGFSRLAEARGLFEGMIGSSEEDIELQDQLGATFLGDAEARDRVKRRIANRVAAFQGGGGAAATQGGVIGLRESE